MMRLMVWGAVVLGWGALGGAGVGLAQGGRVPQAPIPRVPPVPKGQVPKHIEVSGVVIDGTWERVECVGHKNGQTTVLTTNVKPMWVGDAVVYESGVDGKTMTNVLLSEVPIAVEMLAESSEVAPWSRQNRLRLTFDEKGRACYLRMEYQNGGEEVREISERDKDGVKGTFRVKEGRGSGRVEHRPTLSAEGGDWGVQFDLKIEGKVWTVEELLEKKHEMMKQEELRGGGVVLWEGEPQELRYGVAYQESVQGFGPVRENTVILLSSQPISVEAIRRGLARKSHAFYPELSGSHVTIRFNQEKKLLGAVVGKYHEEDGSNHVVAVSEEFLAGRVEIVDGRVRGGIQLDAQKWNKPKYNILDVTFDAEIVKPRVDVAK